MKFKTAVAAFMITTSVAGAQSLPAGDVTIVVPYSAGTSTDMFARKLAEQMTQQGSNNILVENVPGAEGLIGGRRVANGPTDGTSLLYTSSSLTVVQPAVDPDKFGAMATDLKPVCIMANIPVVLWVKADAPYDDLKGLIEHAEGSDRGVRYAFASGNQNLIARLTGQVTGMKLAPIGFKSTTEAITAVASGEVDFIYNDYVGARAYHDSGNLKPIIITSAERVGYLPDVPTAHESGFTDLVVVPWSGLFIGADTPDEIAAHYETLMRTALDSESVREMEAKGGFTIGQECGADAVARQKRESELWKNVAAAN